MAQTKPLGEWQRGDPADADHDDDADHEGTSEYGVIDPPCILAVILTCPSCGARVQVTAKLQSRLTRDQDGTGAIALRVKSAKAQHICGQISLGLVEGPRER